MKAFFIFKDGELFGSPIGYTRESGAKKALTAIPEYHELMKGYKEIIPASKMTDELKKGGMYEYSVYQDCYLLKKNTWTTKVWNPFVKENYQILEKEFEIVFKD